MEWYMKESLAVRRAKMRETLRGWVEDWKDIVEETNANHTWTRAANMLVQMHCVSSEFDPADDEETTLEMALQYEKLMWEATKEHKELRRNLVRLLTRDCAKAEEEGEEYGAIVRAAYGRKLVEWLASGPPKREKA